MSSTKIRAKKLKLSQFWAILANFTIDHCDYRVAHTVFIFSGVVRIMKKSIFCFFDVFKIWPPGGARPFVYFFVFACLHHVPLRSTQVSFHEVITFYNIKLFLKSIFVPVA